MTSEQSCLIVEHQDRVATITLNRPKVLNALNDQMIDALIEKLERFDQDPETSVIVIRGSDKAFAAGVDIPVMMEKNYAEVQQEDFISRNYDKILKIRKPLIAAVAGYALGGGCELAMMCDMIIAGDNARFAQPEVKVGTIPGIGGTQRLTRTVGKSLAMYLCLSARQITAQEAMQAGLVAKIYPLQDLWDEVGKLAKDMAKLSLPLLQLVKESVNQALETHLSAGLSFERRLFHATFALDDRKEGMQAFVEKRPPHFRNK